jgi:uncharacterized cupredoxin-like copper-binding protein
MAFRSVLPLLALVSVALAAGCIGQTAQAAGNQAAKGSIKELYIESFVVFEDGKPYPQYSVKEITVNKGDTVRLLINTTKGTHDFNIDEFQVFAPTPTGQLTVVEFVADKAGEFIYYCAMPNHRANGHWGTLKVME